jgi:hypothetical protein
MGTGSDALPGGEAAASGNAVEGDTAPGDTVGEYRVIHGTAAPRDPLRRVRAGQRRCTRLPAAISAPIRGHHRAGGPMSLTVDPHFEGHEPDA